ncbi:MAG: OmpA family protein [Bacteroidales bacterium]|nr:OmpA family protein [Bacteroidales bacterium]MBN2697722.1 OmpA family protein [Bacteroidales bacterium]
MKRLSLLFFLLLVAWIFLATYWYVCKIRDHCNKGDQVPATELPETLKPAGSDDALPEDETGTDSLAIALDYLNRMGTRTYYFDFASAEFSPRPDENQYLSSLQTVLRKRPDAVVTIEGHSDNRGSEAANDQFARLRAEAVMNYFTENGIPGGRIRTVSKSDREPAATNQTEEGRKLNRRAQIIIN